MSKNTETSKQDNYTCKIISASESLTPQQKLASMDTQTMAKISDLDGTDEIITVQGMVKLQIHNPNPKEDGNRDYVSTVYHTDKGLFYTGSESFANSFSMLEDNAVALGIPANEIKIQVVSKKSQNNQGKMLLAKYVG